MSNEVIDHVAALTGRAAEVNDQVSTDLGVLFDQVNDSLDREEILKKEIFDAVQTNQDSEQSAVELVYKIQDSIRKSKVHHDDELRRIRRKYQNEVKEKKLQIEDLTTQLADALQGLEIFKEDLRKARLHEADLKATVSAHEGSIKELTSQRDNAIQESKTLKNQLEQAKQREIDIKILSSQSLERSKKEETLIKDLTSQRDVARRENQAIKKELEQAKQDQATLKTKNSKVEERHESLVREVEDCKRENTRLEIQLQRNSEQSATEIENLKLKLNEKSEFEAQAVCDEHEEKIKFFKNALYNLKEDNSSILTENARLKDEIDDHCVAKDILMERIFKLEEKSLALESQTFILEEREKQQANAINFLAESKTPHGGKKRFFFK